MSGDDPDPSALSVDLVRRIQDGDHGAWEALYLRYRDRLLLAVRCRLGPGLRARLESEDILHSVVREALDELPGFEARGPGALEHYLHQCVTNKIRSKAEYFGAAKRRGGHGLTDSLADRLPAESGPPRYLDEERYGRLERALAALPEALREVVVLRRIEGLSNLEAAAAIGKSPEATSKLHARGIARLTLALSAGEPPE